MHEAENDLTVEAGKVFSLTGKHMLCRFENGWVYEFYFKNAATVDYRVHSGPMASRWGRGQEAHLRRLTEGVFHAVWEEPTGVGFALAVQAAARQAHLVLSLPRWAADEPQKTVCYQNERLRQMQTLAKLGPTYPKQLLSLHGAIPFLDERGPNDQTVIECEVDELPPGYAERRK